MERWKFRFREAVMTPQPMNWKKSQVSLTIALLVVSAAPSLLRAQDSGTAKPDAPAQQQPVATAPVIRTESRVVLVDAVVTDKKGNYVHDLIQKDFKVYEDNKEQAVTSFSFGNDPSGPVSAQ